ncbi:hypothetical protein NA56DRAFT_698355 [Hyaloscypha hepaticicola]|uniref:BTB domain-containing protein n=1 Tax=Hyaloscypha hepaticicola TaxID=2082293 RepID=A0A2J6QIV3_9HELO|nr:hypothetical protein NA56DRAFT_698355 [Hyaloscypha hepaticicola]
MSAPFEAILLSRPFKFLIGVDEIEIVVHEEAIASQSPALEALMRGKMSESASRVATWVDVGRETFVRFAQFAYTGDYSVPKMIVSCQVPQPEQCEKATEVEKDLWAIEAPPTDDWASVFAARVKDKKKKKGAQLTNRERSRSLQTADYTIFDKSQVYALLQPRSKFADSCDPEIIDGPEENNITEALLSHTLLYILAEKWGIDSLKMLTLFKLHRTLSMLVLDSPKVPHVMELVRHGYAGTPDLETGIDGLRDLLCQYVAANVKIMSEHEAFLALIQDGGTFVRDLWKRVLPRIG